MAKIIKFGTEAKEKMRSGSQVLCDAVVSTYGPGGKTVSIKDMRGFRNTKDGVSVANAIDLEDPFENMAAISIKEAAQKSNLKVGDGTTGTVLLTNEIFKNGLQYVSMGANATQIRNGIMKAAKIVADYITDNSIPVKSSEDVKHIATVSANGDEEIGTIIADVMDKIGLDGTIKVEQGNTLTMDSKILEGLVLDSSYVSPYLVTDESRMEADFANPYILLINKKVQNIHDILEPLQYCAGKGAPVVVIANEYQDDIIATFIMNKLKGIQCIAVKSPSYGEQRKFIMDDVAIVCGATVVSDETGVTATSEVLGRAKRVIVNKENTIIVGGFIDENEEKMRVAAVEKRAEDLRNQMNALEDDWEKNRIAERLAKITSGVGFIFCGGSTEIEARERRDRVDDSFNSAKTALRSGVVAGCGSTLLCAQKVLEALLIMGEQFKTEDEKTGAKIVMNALTAPTKKILENAGVQNYELLVAKIQDMNNPRMGYSVHEGKIADMIESNIIDAADVVKNAILNSASVAGLLLTTDCLITDNPEDKKAIMQQQQQMM